MYRNKTDGSAELSARLYFLTISGVSCNITVGTFHAAPGPKSGAARRGRLRALISTLFTANVLENLQVKEFRKSVEI